MVSGIYPLKVLQENLYCETLQQCSTLICNYKETSNLESLAKRAIKMLNIRTFTLPVFVLGSAPKLGKCAKLDGKKSSLIFLFRIIPRHFGMRPKSQIDTKPVSSRLDLFRSESRKDESRHLRHDLRLERVSGSKTFSRGQTSEGIWLNCQLLPR